MRILRKSLHLPQYYDAHAQDARIIASHRVIRCGVCTYEVPEADVVLEDGLQVCPLCQDVMTADWLAEEQKRVAEIKAESARRLVQPPQVSFRALEEKEVAAVTSITDATGNLLSQTTPLRVIRNTATTVLVNGQNLSSLVTFTYPTNMSNNSAPLVNSTKLITLSIITTAGAATGAYSLTINDGVSTLGHKYLNIFAVR